MFLKNVSTTALFRLMYWDSVSRLVAPGGLLVSILVTSVSNILPDMLN